jgi:hypothetical protein
MVGVLKVVSFTALFLDWAEAPRHKIISVKEVIIAFFM